MALKYQVSCPFSGSEYFDVGTTIRKRCALRSLTPGPCAPDKLTYLYGILLRHKTRNNSIYFCKEIVSARTHKNKTENHHIA